MIHLKSDNACLQCPAAAMCISHIPLVSLAGSTDICHCPKCYSVLFSVRLNTYVCTLIRNGKHAVDPTLNKLRLVRDALYGDDVPERQRITCVCKQSEFGCVEGLQGLGCTLEVR